MKRIKKLASLFLSMVMALSMCLCVSATGATPPTDSTTPGNYPSGDGTTFTITINETAKGYVYEALQIFTGDLNVEANGKKTLSNIKWGSAIDVNKAAEKFQTTATNDTPARAMTAAEVAALIAGDAETNVFDSAAAQGYAQDLAACLKAPKVAAGTSVQNATTGLYEIGGLAAGYYMVENTTVPEDADYTRYMLEVVGDVTATPKTGTIEHEKYINDKPAQTPEGEEGRDFVKVNDAPIGETVDYVIPVKLPENFDSYKNYYLQFQDALMKGLALDPTTVKVQVVTDKALTDGKSVANKDDVKTIVEALTADNSKDVTTNFHELDRAITSDLVTKYNLPVNEGTLLQVWNTNLKTLNTEGNVIFGNNTWVILTYTATLTENAVIGIPNTNYVKIVYANNPNDTGDGEPDNPNNPDPQNPTGETPNKDVETFTTELAILKTNGTDILPGVEFTLTSDNATHISLVTAESFVEDANGAYWKLKNGTYTLTAPDTTGSSTDTSDQYVSTTQKYAKTVTLTTTPAANGKVEVVGTVDAQGRVVFTGLGEGDYVLKETKTLAGYNTIEDIAFKITFNSTDKTFTSDNATVIVGKSNNTFESTIVNQRGSLLPSTGGIGTTIFYVVGAVLVIGAGVLLVTKRRMRAQ
ncbi:MAG TPA: hypothetical protein DD414_01365 [Lachnospiraceae bacterium]|nr:hypothetical protein [Lachnospiraceae bacterium]